MAVEQSETNISGGREQENAAQPQADAPAPQHVLALAPGDPPAEPADAHDGRRARQTRDRRSRYDVRRTAEYLAERGRMPAESLHLIARRTLPEAVSYLRKHVKGVSDEWCANFWMRCQVELMPYTAIRAADVELPSLGSSIGGIHAHFLAAGMASLALAQGGAGAAVPGLSNNHRLFDSDNPLAQRAEIDGGTSNGTNGAQNARLLLPPIGKD